MNRVTLLFVWFLCAIAGAAHGQKPEGRFLFQPRFTWANKEVSFQGTGYLIEHEKAFFGVTSIHFLDFDAGGLEAAFWCDIPTDKPLIAFAASLGKPAVQEIKDFKDIQHDFLLLPTNRIPENSTTLSLESVPTYPAGTRLWFPNKDSGKPIGYEWIDAVVLSDEGHVLKVELPPTVKLRSQSGSPFLNQETGKVVGMLMGGEEIAGKNVLYLCPARGIVKHLAAKPAPVSLMESIKKE